MLQRDDPPPGPVDHIRGALKRGAAELVQWGWEAVVELGSIGPRSRRGRRFGAFGEGSVICFPPVAIFNERYIHIGTGTLIGPHVSLSAGMVPGQVPVSDPVISIGDRCLIGKGSGLVGHLSIEVGDDVWTGHYVYVTDQNHGYEDVTLPISKQTQAERPVVIGSGSWLGHGTVVLPGRAHRQARRGRGRICRLRQASRQLRRGRRSREADPRVGRPRLAASDFP